MSHVHAAVGGWVYKLRVVSSDEDVARFLRVRRDGYLATGLITGDDLVDGVYRDRYDEHCIHVLAESDAGPVGCARLITPTEGHSLQVASHFELDIRPSDAEISGFAVLDPERHPLASLGLMRSMFELARLNAVNFVYAEVEPWFFRYLCDLGFPFEQLTESRWLYNAENFAVRLSIPEYARTVAAAVANGTADAIASYFARSFAWSISGRDLTPEQRPAVDDDRQLA